VLKDYISIARPDHWFKNIFMVPGVALAVLLIRPALTPALLADILIAFVSTCLLASANYTINEWLDAQTDRHHPDKQQRPSVLGNVTGGKVFIQWLLLGAVGLSLAFSINDVFLLLSCALIVMGVIYNVRPFRTKDRQYFDVITESVNNPIRLLLGWTAITTVILPPSSLIAFYWMGGAFLMAAKRYAEYRHINDAEQASRYRKSFARYTDASLLLSAFFYALMAGFLAGVFLIKYRIEYLFAIPPLAGLFVYYLHLALAENSIVQSPEKLYSNKPFVIYLVLVVALVVLLSFVSTPWLEILLQPIPLQPAGP